MKPEGRSSVKRWNAAVAVAHEDDAAKRALDEVLAMSDDDVDAELARAGVDMAKLDARVARAFAAFQGTEEPEAVTETHDAVASEDEGGAWVAKVEAPPSGRRDVKRGGARRSYAMAYAAAAAAATVGIATYLATRPPPPETPEVKTPDAGAPVAPTPSVEPPVDAKNPANEGSGRVEKKAKGGK